MLQSPISSSWDCTTNSRHLFIFFAYILSSIDRSRSIQLLDIQHKVKTNILLCEILFIIVTTYVHILCFLRFVVY